MVAKLSYSVRKILFYEALTCSRTLGSIDPILILIDPFFKKNPFAWFFAVEMFYQPKWEISSLVKKNCAGNYIEIFALFF